MDEAGGWKMLRLKGLRGSVVGLKRPQASLYLHGRDDDRANSHSSKDCGTRTFVFLPRIEAFLSS